MSVIEEFDRVWERWKGHKELCRVCRRGMGTCSIGRPLRDATLRLARLAQAEQS